MPPSASGLTAGRVAQDVQSLVSGGDSVRVSREVMSVAAIAGAFVLLGVGIYAGLPGWMLKMIVFYVGFLVYPVIAVGSGEGFMIAGLIPWLATLVFTAVVVRAVARLLGRHGAPRTRIYLVGILISLVLVSAGAAASHALLAVLLGN